MKSKIHTPRPSGPHSTGAIDVMIGRNKEGTLLRIFYPSEILDINTEIDRWTKWNLGGKYADGWGKFYLPLFPTFYSAVADRCLKNVLVPTIWEAPILKGTFPVIIYSHGLTANRSCGSTTCADIASHGYIVAVVEHRDGSASGSFVLNEENKKVWIPFKVVQKGENEYEMRKSQLEIRTREASRALDILEHLNTNGVKNDLKSDFDLSHFQGKMDLSKPIICGHSFGGCTSLLTLARDKRFTSGILQDPWTFPIKDDISMLITRIKQPIIFILMETFQCKDNLEGLKRFHEAGSQFVTIRKGNHFHQTDIPMVLPTLLHGLGNCRSDASPHTIMQLNNKIIMKFLWETSEEKPDWLKENKKYLDRNQKHLIFEPQGSSKSMIGWSSLSKSTTK